MSAGGSAWVEWTIPTADQARAILSIVERNAGGLARTFWAAAVEPFRHVTPQTVLLIAFTVLLAWLIARVIRSSTWRFSKPVAQGLEVVTTYHTNTQTIALSPEEYIRAFAPDPAALLENNPSRAARFNWGVERHKREHSNYFVVTLAQRDDPKTPTILATPVLTRELRIWRKANPPKEGWVQLDASCLREVRDHNNSSADDIDGEVICGRYDMYLRRVRWWDVRHWLVHPNREIRIAVWVTLISMVVPALVDVLFSGPTG